MRRALAFVLAILFCLPASATGPGERVQFAFHSHFLLNLHHFLFDNATLGKFGPRAEWQAVTDPFERAGLEQAAAYYRNTYARSDVFDPDMDRVKLALSRAPDAQRSVAGLALPPALAGALERAAPLYARTIWPIHDSANRRWIRQARALDAVFGQQLKTGIEGHLHRTFPASPARVDVVFHTGERSGAYTSDDDPMQTIMPSARTDYQGLAALEMLYHEGAHMRVNGAVIDAINASLAAAGRAPNRALWHAVHCYTVGETVKSVLKARGVDYTPYADQAGIYQRGSFKTSAPLLAIWRRHMTREISFQDAIDGMTAALPPP